MLAFVSLARGSATSATSATSRRCQAPGLFRTPKAYPQPPLVHGCALAYFRGNLTDYAHAWTGMNHLPQAPQSSALPSCATARCPISMGQENVTGQSTWRAVGHNPSTARTRSHVPHRPTKRVGRRLAIATRRLRGRLWSRCGGRVPISNTGNERDDPDDQGNDGRERRRLVVAIAQVAQRSNRDDLTQEHRDNSDRTKSRTATRVLKT